MRRLWMAVAGGSVTWLASVVYAGDWPQFRGPNAAGLGVEENLPSAWSTGKNIQWRVAIPGVAWSSPIVWGERVFVTTAITENQPRPRPGMPFGGYPGRPGGENNPDRTAPGSQGGGAPPRPGRPGGIGGEGKAPEAVYRWEVHCYQRDDGKLLWKQLAVEGKPSISTHNKNTYASETPVTDGRRVYAYFGMTGVYCYDFAGSLVWKTSLGSHKMRFGWGTGSSPALEEGRLFIVCDNEEKSFLAALDTETGKELWRVDREERSTWATPFVWRTKLRTELVTSGAKRIRSYDPATGKQHWELGGMNMQVAASPVAGEELLFIGSGGPFGGRPLYAVRPGAAGNLTLKEGEPSNAGVAWYNKDAGPAMASPLVYGDHIYILSQNGGLLSCLEAKTGKAAYAKQRLPQAVGFTSSPWAYDGKVFCLDENGQTFVVKAGPDFKLLGTNKLDEMFMATPAIAGDALILRGIDHLYCVRASTAQGGTK
jgi:outer membrane protein assembly factor BamB